MSTTRLTLGVSVRQLQMFINEYEVKRERERVERERERAEEEEGQVRLHM